MPKKSSRVFPSNYGTFTRIVVASGPYPPNNDFIYALYFTAPEPLDEEEWKILSTFNSCPIYVGEPLPTYAPGEYRRIYKGPLPTNLPGTTATQAYAAYLTRIALLELT